MKIFFIGDSPSAHTGFGTVSRNLLLQLHSMGYEIEVLGINEYGTNPHYTDNFPFPIWPCEKGSFDNIYGIHKAWDIQRELKPDIVFILNDPWIIQSYIEAKPTSTPYSKYVGYFPIDAGPLKKEWADTLDSLDAQICYTNFAERVLIEAHKNKKRPNNLYQIYHGVDTTTYHPLNQQATRRNLGLPEDAFIVGMVARNQYRKRFDILVKAFARFAKNKPNTKLYLHTVIKDVGYDISDLTQQFGIQDKLILTEGMESPAHMVPETMLNAIYNVLDVHCLISLGDGFGLPVAESMAVGCPQIVSGHSGLQELVEGHGGYTVKTAAWLMHTAGVNTWGGLSDVDDLVTKLEKLYTNKQLREKFSQEAYSFITQEKFQWSTIAKQFDAVFKTVYHLI